MLQPRDRYLNSQSNQVIRAIPEAGFGGRSVMPDLHGFRIKEIVAMSSPVVRSRNVLKRNSMRFAATLLGALASFVAGPNAALATAPQHHDQAPGFFRLKVGDLEVTALYDGTGVFDPHWLNGTKATMDGVVKG